MADARIWDAFRSFLTTVTETAAAHLRNEAQCQELARHLPALETLNPEGTVGALCAYFTQVPAHWNAINRLDHNLLVNVLDLGGGVHLDFRVVLEPFSKLGPVPHGNVWLALVQLAYAVNPSNVNVAECQSFIRSQMSTDSTVGIQLPAPAQLESVMGSIVKAFPGLQDCMSQIMSGDVGGNGPDDVNAIVDRVQSVLVQPLLASLRSSNPDAPDLSPAISKILDGFRGLNAAISPGMGSSMDM